MLAEAYIKNDEIRVINFPQKAFKGNHWKISIEPIEEIKEIEGKINNSLDKYIGKWSEDKEFDKVIAEFNKVDKGLWL